MAVEFSTTRLGRQCADWALTDGHVTVFGFVDSDRDGDRIDMTRFDRVDALWCEPRGVVFPHGRTIVRCSWRVAPGPSCRPDLGREDRRVDV